MLRNKGFRHHKPKRCITATVVGRGVPIISPVWKLQCNLLSRTAESGLPKPTLKAAKARLRVLVPSNL